MRKTHIFTWMCLAGAVLAATPAWAQEPALNRVADGGFENGFVSLALPAMQRFPMVANGWASRGPRAPEVIEGIDAAYEGLRALRLATQPGEDLHLIQDLPLNGGGYIVRFAFFYEYGAQTVSLLTAWDRGNADAGDPAFVATMSGAGIDVQTPEGRWTVSLPLTASQWYVLQVVADPRDQSQSVFLDGSQVLLLPGTAASTPRMTLVIGNSGDTGGAFRYDAIEAFSLIDLELEALRQAARRLEDPIRGWTLRRFDAAASALSQNAPTLALPELDVARSLMASAMLPVDAAPGDLRAAIAGYRLALDMGRGIDDLIALIDARRN